MLAFGLQDATGGLIKSQLEADTWLPLATNGALKQEGEIQEILVEVCREEITAHLLKNKSASVWTCELFGTGVSPSTQLCFPASTSRLGIKEAVYTMSSSPIQGKVFVLNYWDKKHFFMPAIQLQTIREESQWHKEAHGFLFPFPRGR